MRPGTNIAIRETPPVRSVPTDTGVWFIAGFAEKGSATAPILIQSMSDFERLLGDRVSYSYLYDAADTFFREGGGTIYVARVFGPTPTYATITLLDGASGSSLVVKANSPGAWGAELNIEVQEGDDSSEFVLIVSHDTDGTLETSPSFESVQEALDWANLSDYISLTDGGSGEIPDVIGAQSLTGGTDDRTNATDATWKAAIDRFSRDLGPGQVSYPGRTTSQAHADLLTHAMNNNRVAVLDAPNSGTKATVLAAADAARTANARYGAMFAPWLVIPGLTGGTTRTVPPSALVAGKSAALDVSASPNTPAAGERGISLYATGISQASWTDAEREDLNDNGVNVLRLMSGQVRVYGWRSLANPDTESNWINFGNVRLVMAIAAQADLIGEQFMFDEIDGQGRTIGKFNAALSGMLLTYWQAGSLYGQTAEQAYLVDTGAQVNTPTTIADGQLRAVLGLRASPFAEMVTIEIVKTPITEEV